MKSAKKERGWGVASSQLLNPLKNPAWLPAAVSAVVIVVNVNVFNFIHPFLNMFITLARLRQSRSLPAVHCQV